MVSDTSQQNFAIIQLLRKLRDEDLKNLDVAAHLQNIGRCLNGEWGTYWVVNSHANKLFPAEIWNASHVDVQGLKQQTKIRTLSLNEGMAGQVWKSRKPRWTEKLNQDMCLPHSLAAEDIGFRYGIWFAIKSYITVYGVIEILGKQLAEPSEESMLAIEILGIQLGRILSNAC